MSEHLPPMKLPSHDVLAQLARDDPQAFDALRQELIENRINRAPERLQHRLRVLQFRVDGIRRLAGSPLGATLKIQALMWNYFLKMNEKLQGLVRLTDTQPQLPRVDVEAQPEAKPPPLRSARIIEFKPRRPVAAGSHAAELKR